MKPNEYRCAACKGVFEKGWSEDEAVAELGQAFPDFEPGECEVVCDDCYKAMGLGDAVFTPVESGK